MMDYKELPEKECEALLIELFQSIPKLLQRVAPDGYEKSELFKVHHPSPEQQYEEYCRMKENLQHLSKKDDEEEEPLPSFEEFKKDLEEREVDEAYEIADVFGNCLWNIFSNNHTVHNGKGEWYDLGSWRGSGGFIADVINELKIAPGKSFDYIDFYMGHYMLEDRANLTPVYEFIFRKLKDKGLDWEFSFPRMGLVSFQSDDDTEQKPEDYDPAKAVEEQFEKQKKKEEIADFQQKLDDIYEQEYEEAKYQKPQQEVMAYYHVYGHWPEGHPLAGKE